MRYGLLLTFALFVLGCGGSSSSSSPPNITPGFYRGTYLFQSNGLPDATAPMVADVSANGDLTAHAMGQSINATITVSGSTGTVIHNGATLTGGASVLASGNNLDLTITQANTFSVTSTLSPSSLPTLGATTTVPGAGTYTGELLVVSNGHVKAMGSVTATVNGDGTWVGISSGGGAWVNSGIFSGEFEAGGTLSNASIFISGNVINQSIAPQFSFDGTTLIVKYDNLALEPASAWMTLTVVP